MTIPANQWSLRDDQPRIIPHRAAPPRGPLRYELHCGGKVASRHATVVGMLLAKLEKGGERMVRVGPGVVPWVRGEVTCGE